MDSKLQVLSRLWGLCTVQRSYGDVVSAFVAMAAHKWVESIAVATAFLAAGCGMVAVWAFLVPFSLGPLVGIAIGVSVDNSSTWAIMVLFSLVSGAPPPPSLSRALRASRRATADIISLGTPKLHAAEQLWDCGAGAADSASVQHQRPKGCLGCSKGSRGRGGVKEQCCCKVLAAAALPARPS